MKAPKLGGAVSSKEVSDHLLSLAERVKKVRWKDRNPASRQALIGLVRTLDALVDDESHALALVNLMTEDDDDEMFVAVTNPTLGPHIGFELSGRLTNLAHRMASLAANLEHQSRHHPEGHDTRPHSPASPSDLFGPPRKGKGEPD